MVSVCRPRGLLFVILEGVACKSVLGHGTLGIRPLPFPPKPATAFGREHLRWGGIVFSKMSITLGGLGIYGLYQPFIAKWLFVFNSNFLRMKEAHRSASSLRQRIDHPPPPRSDRKSRVVWIMSPSPSAARTFFRATLPLSDIWLAKPTACLALFVRPW